MDDLNKAALEQFVYQPVSRDMISYLANAAHNVIACDSTLMPPPPRESSKGQDRPLTPPRTPEPRPVCSTDDALPTLDEFITQLVVSSNVQVPTLMSTLVYLNRLKSKLQPMARGLRCTTHRIFLAALILSAKYLNDSSPKNKHWANYTHMNTDYYSFGFTRTEVNLMEKQLLFLLEWELRITEHDLYRELDCFLEPLRLKIAERHARKMRHREEKKRQQELYAAAARYPSPVSSRSSRSRHASPDHYRTNSNGSVTPPGLVYSSASSYASSIASSRRESPSPYLYGTSQGSLYDSPVQIVMDRDEPKVQPSARMLSYADISVESYEPLNEVTTKKRHRRALWERLIGTAAVAVR
ncbi:cyclin [Trichoderma chlorosporum]